MSDGSMRGRLLNIGVLIAFTSPLLVYWIYCLFINPAPNYEAIDPEYEYFLNSLAVFKHQPYVYVDHPGTPVEMIGSAILAGTYPWLAGRPEGFAGFHLRNPQVFLNLAYSFMVLIHLACVVIFFRIGSRSGATADAVLGAALAAMYFAIQPYSFSGSVLWSHNSFSFPFGTLLLLLLYRSMMQVRSGTGIPTATLVGLGLGTGVVAAITIFLASWAAGILTAIVLFHVLQRLPWRNMALAVAAFGLSSIAGFYLAVLPVIDKMGGFWRWIYSILSHQSNYLAVPNDEPALQRISENVAELFHLLPALFIAMVIAIALTILAFVLWKGSLREKAALWALAGGFSVQVLALTLVFLDRPLRAYYFLGVAAIIPVLALVILQLYDRAPAARRLLSAAISGAVLIGLLANSYQAVAARQAQARTLVASQAMIRKIVLQRSLEMNRSPESMTVLWMYGTYSPCWGLWFADHRAGDAFDREIQDICPNQYELAGRVLLPQGKAPLESTPWDIIFTCDRFVDDVLAKDQNVTVKQYPAIEWTCGNMAVILNK